LSESVKPVAAKKVIKNVVLFFWFCVFFSFSACFFDFFAYFCRMRLSTFITEIRPSDRVFVVKFPDEQRGWGPNFGAFSRSSVFEGFPRPVFDKVSLLWRCDLGVLDKVNGFLVAIAIDDVAELGSLSVCDAATQTPDSIEVDVVEMAEALLAERRADQWRALMGPKPRLLRERNLYERQPELWIARRRAMGELDHLPEQELRPQPPPPK
jgi:hypothetical protein